MTRLTVDQAADALGVSVSTASKLAQRRGWDIEADGTFSRADVEAERVQRARCADQDRGHKAPTADGFTRTGAEKLAQRIRDYWAKRGRVANIWVEPADEYTNSLRTAAWFVVRSDMVDGRPRK